ncbi:hypothetical protein F2Q65_14755 [Thiohalocapsa marina]|uniref:Uncharacterized protein n=1 Tax=Thiohalocapsa marina TaxID=424902 RepID=A0A5M8FFP5_9GAMM|nr:hypothetical protein [Thiohalocapsa marina]KAA6183698.1 hypothetical protein F2Q65_14755 [Thiohalocapsa marina]
MRQSVSEAMPGLDWFEAGEAAYLSACADGLLYPPLGDAVAQRWWLGGFVSAWAASADARTVAEALADALRGWPALERQLREHRGPANPWPRH